MITYPIYKLEIDVQRQEILYVNNKAFMKCITQNNVLVYIMAPNWRQTIFVPFLRASTM